MRFIIIISFLVVLNNFVFTQSQKKIRKNKISMISEVVSDETSKKFTESIIKFDKKGNEIYHEEYNSKKKLKKKFEREYTDFNEISKEKIYDDKGDLLNVIVTRYELELPIEKLTYNNSNVLIEKKTIKYNGFNEKTEENIFNEAEELIEKVVYEYNNKGLKTAKIKYDGKGKMIESKEYIYQYDK